MEFVVKVCKKCLKDRKFLAGSERDKQSICGECWDWAHDEEHPINKNI